MTNLNVFINEVLTVDYSHFWSSMEVIESVDETKMQTGEDSWRIKINCETATFKSFSDTETGEAYCNKFRWESLPTEPCHELTQNALTELLNLPQEALQRQVDRLFNINLIWGNNGNSGVLADHSLLYDSFNLIPGIDLSSFDSWIGKWATTKNRPYGPDKIYLRKDFCLVFIAHVCDKIHAVSSLIFQTGICPQNIPTPNSPLANSNQLINIENYTVDKTTTTNNYSYVFVEPNARLKIKDLLRFSLAKTDDANKQRFNDLIDGLKIDEKIKIEITGIALADFFGQVITAGGIQRRTYTKDYVARWLTYWFLDGQGVPFKPNYLIEHITKKHKKLNGKIKYQ